MLDEPAGFVLHGCLLLFACFHVILETMDSNEVNQRFTKLNFIVAVLYKSTIVSKLSNL